jgi:hypothetical protein
MADRGLHRFFFTAVLRLRPALIRAARVLPSTPPLFQRVERRAFEGQFGGFSDSGIQRCPQTSQNSIHRIGRLRRYTGRTTEIQEFRRGKQASSNSCGEALLDHQLARARKQMQRQFLAGYRVGSRCTLTRSRLRHNISANADSTYAGDSFPLPHTTQDWRRWYGRGV